MGLVEVVREKYETIVFADLAIGETFRYKDRIYLKYFVSRMDTDSAFAFEDNRPVIFNGMEKVTRVNCKLVVED